MKKRAFTMLELVFVIVVIGILAASIIPNTRRNTLREAATQLVSHIRYTQHLAMVDDKFDANDPKWFRKRWQIIFGKSLNTSNPDTNDKWAYTIFADNAGASSGSNPGLSEMAIDPLNRDKYLSGGYSGSLDSDDKRANKKMNLGISYGITGISMSGGCSASNVRISFDHLGRPIDGNLTTYTKSYKSSKLLQTRCNIIL